MRQRLSGRAFIKLLSVSLLILAAVVARAETFSAFSLDEKSGLSATKLYRADFALGDLLQVSNGRGLTYDVTIARSTFSSLGHRTLSGTTENNGTFVLIVAPDGQLQGSLSEGHAFYNILSENGYPILQLRNYLALPSRIDDAPMVPEFTPIGLGQHLLEPNPTDLPARSFYQQGRTTTSAANTDTVYPVYHADTAINVLVYYDSKMTTPEATIDYLFEYSNLAYARTGIALTLKLAGLIPVSISSSQDNTTVLDLLKNKEVPFTLADQDRAALNADLVHIIRVDKEEQDEVPNCGIASYSVYKGQGYRDAARGITEWKPPDGLGSYCSEAAFTHEIGHNLGAAHHREDYSEPRTGAYHYSYGAGRSGVFNTIMGSYRDGFEETIAVFSDPDSDCLGDPCGVSPEYSDSADNKRTLSNAKFIVASYEGGGFDHAAVQEAPIYASCADGTSFRGLNIRNSSRYALELMSRTFLRVDGSIYLSSAFDEGEFVLRAGQSSSWGYCLAEDDQPFGPEITEAFFTYKNPETGDEVEGTHLFFDDDYDGEYGIVRAASGAGGSVVGHPSIHARVDAEVRITFQPDYGHKLSMVTGTCPGSLHYNVYTAEPLYGDCWTIAKFEVDANSISERSLNEISEAYIGLLGRAPDRNGLGYWALELDKAVATGKNPGIALKKIANDMTLSEEWASGIGINNGLTQEGAEEVVRAMYLNLFARSATNSDVAYWSSDLTSGRVTESEMAVLLIIGAKANGSIDSVVLDYKRQAARYYATMIPQSTFTRGTAKDAVAGVEDLQSLTASQTDTNELVDASD